MKLERLYAITVYLLNHGRTSASELAKHFEVSLRTIQRDMDSLCLAGIPVISIAGAAGGYEISENSGWNTALPPRTIILIFRPHCKVWYRLPATRKQSIRWKK